MKKKYFILLSGIILITIAICVFKEKIWCYAKYNFIIHGELNISKYKKISKNFDNTFECAKAIENNYINKFSKNVIREKNNLKIKLKKKNG